LSAKVLTIETHSAPQ